MTTLNNELQNELMQALKNNEFILYYQPQFNLATSTFEGIEALIRWKHPHKGLLMPLDFILKAEESDVIIDIGEWVLKSACLQMKIWQDKGLSPVRMAVNVANKQLKQRNFYELVMNTLKEVHLDPIRLELELSENIMIDNDDIDVIDTIKRLKNAGILIALDDFGMGNSNATYLAKIPVDRIKIDKSYINNIHNATDAAIVKSLIMLAEKLNLQIVAEGVETLMQLQMLLTHECKEIQGYYYSEPLPAEQVEVFLIANKNRK
jgi:EAL domain-containing protein (putative c-di-GMP-specific phosphodiesterase class I)